MEHSREVRQTAANIKQDGRKLRRKEQKEVDYINRKFHDLEEKLSQALFGFDWDTAKPPYSTYDIFAAYNEQWKEFCRKWHNGKHIIPARIEAFEELFIDNVKLNKDDTPNYFGNPNLAHVCWVI